MDADVVVVGAGPTGLMLAGELAGRGVRTLLLERRAEPSQVAKAGGLAGQVLQLLHLRGELERFGSEAPMPAPRFPFGGLHLDFSPLGDSPMRALLLPQPQLESVLAERALERGAEVRRGHAVVGFEQDDEGTDDGGVTVEVRGPGSAYDVRARFLVGCDGGRSRVRELAGIGFAGTSLPEVERLCSFTMPEGVRVSDDGSLEVEGVGTLPFGYTATEHGVFACHGTGDVMGVYTAEVEETAYDDEASVMTVEEMAASVKRVMGLDLPLGEPLRLTRFGYSAKQADTYRAGRVLLAGDAAHLFPAGGVAVNAGMLDAANLAWKLVAEIQGWAPAGLLDTYTSERRAAAERTLLHTRAQVALRKASGPGGDALRALFLELAGDAPALRRLGALMAGTDQGSPEGAGLVGDVLTDRLLGVPHHDARFAGLLGAGRPVVLDLARRVDLADVAAGWADRVDVATVALDDRPADAVLVLPDSRIAWAGGDTSSLEDALRRWCGPAA